MSEEQRPVPGPPRKEPQDHLEKVVKPKVEKTEAGYMITHLGVKLVIEAAALDDFELLRDLARMQDEAVSENDRMSMIPNVFTRFFGERQAATVLNVLRDPSTKRVKMADASKFFFEVVRALNPES